jgi:signal transduction histidine kinase
MSNAAKFTSNGVVELSARRLRIGSDDWIEIEVRDTGIGIAREDLKTIFQDYKQVNSVEARKRKGTGLGLALSRKLCMMMGGNIFVDSELGHGARFTIRVPSILSAGDRSARLVKAPVEALA